MSRIHPEAPDRQSQSLRRARTAVSAYFVFSGMLVGAWAARLPNIKGELHLSDGLWGAVLFAVPFGNICILPLVGRVIDQYGSRQVLAMTAPPAALSIIGPAAVSDVAVAVLALFAFGAATGGFDVAMNAHAAGLEAEYGRPIMSSFHACYSIAEILGVGVGALFALGRISPLLNLAAVGASLAAAGVLAARWLRPSFLRGQDHPGPRPPAERRLEGRPAIVIWVLALLALLTQMCEGAAVDWSGVYFYEQLGVTLVASTAGYASFSIAMTIGRLFGDHLAAAFDSLTLISAGALVAAIGFGAGLLVNVPVSVVAGFAFLGLGLSIVVPRLYMAAYALNPVQAGRNVARVTGLSYVGLLGGPVLIGGVASLGGLRGALGILVPLAVMTALISYSLSRGGHSGNRG